jgi:hypothetical protein
MLTLNAQIEGYQDIECAQAYLLRLSSDWLLWDAGLPKKYLFGPLVEGALTTELSRTIIDQLHDLGLSPDDIKYATVSPRTFRSCRPGE